MAVIMCGFHGCHVLDVPSVRECDCINCPSSIPHSICENVTNLWGRRGGRFGFQVRR
jgi:hypothetical protein